MKIAAASLSIRALALLLAISLSPSELAAGASPAGQDSPAGQAQAGAGDQTTAQQNADAAIKKIRDACHVDDSETNPRKINKHLDCVARAIAAQRRKIVTEKLLQSTINQAYGVPKTPPESHAEVQGQASTSEPGSNQGASATGTSTTCGAGTGDNNPLIRVHRLLMAPKDASDDFGYRLARRFIIYQITISNDNTNYQYLLHDVSIDLGSLFGTDSGTYIYAASSQDLTLLRGIPEKGQDLDPRNLTYHLLQGIGSVAGAISGLTPFSDAMGSSMAVFNGPFLQSYVGLAPDHTGTQLNRLSDSAYITNTVIDKQRAKTIAIFVPEATILSKDEQGSYWDDPHAFLQILNLDQADVCVDGAFITTIAPPTLTKAVLTPDVPGASLAPGVKATLTVTGTNLTAGDTQVIGLGTTVTLTTATGTTGSVDVTLPSTYTPGMPVHLASAANPSVTSGTIPTGP